MTEAPKTKFCGNPTAPTDKSVFKSKTKKNLS
jgi:hypothetical protein